MNAEVPLFLTPMVRAWRCRKRGLCCKHQSVQIDEVERRRFERTLRELGDARAASFASDAIGRMGGWAVLPHVEGERCTFLSDDNLCTVRTRIGERLYPRVCKKFPYLSILTHDRQIVGLSFNCPTALQLLAEETHFEVGFDSSEAPVESVAWLGAPDHECRDFTGELIPLEQFWARHWSLVDRFRARSESNPTERLVAFAQDVTGLPGPEPLVLREGLLRQGAFELSLMSALAEVAGEVPEGLPRLWSDNPPEVYELDPLPEIDSDALLFRYLLHRLACPVYYVLQADLRFMLTTLFAMLARYRIERERGVGALDAIRQVDKMFVHGSSGATPFSTQSTSEPWRAMASLARAVTRG